MELIVAFIYRMLILSYFSYKPPSDFQPSKGTHLEDDQQNLELFLIQVPKTVSIWLFSSNFNLNLIFSVICFWAEIRLKSVVFNLRTSYIFIFQPCMCVCIFIYIYIYIHTHTHTYI